MSIEDYWFVETELVQDEWDGYEMLLNIKCVIEGQEIETLHFTDDCIDSENLEAIFKGAGYIEFNEIDKANTLYFIEHIKLSVERAIDLCAALKFGVYAKNFDRSLTHQRIRYLREFETKDYPTLVKILTDAGTANGISLAELGKQSVLVLSLEDIHYLDPSDGENEIIPYAQMHEVMKDRLISVSETDVGRITTLQAH